jgi:hypothetical protein
MSTQVTINDVIPKTQITATAGQTVFTTNWTANVASDVVVYARTSAQTPDDLTQLVSSANYTVAFVGGSEIVEVTFLVGRALNDVITITRDTPADRLNLYTNTNFTPSMLNQDVGILTLVDQQAQLYNQQVAPHYNVSATPNLGSTMTGLGGDIYLPILGANQGWKKNSANTEIVPITFPSSGGLGPSDATYIVQTPWSPSGELPNQQALSPLATGFMSSVTGTGVVSTRTLQGTASQINVTNGTGTGNPVFSLSNALQLPGTMIFGGNVDANGFNISNIGQANIGNIQISGNTIESTDINGDLILLPDGAGDLVLDGLNWPQADGTNGQAVTTNGTGQLGWTSFGAPYTASALTSTSDTNVTITLGGTPATALLQATSITMGWSGQLSIARGGTNNSVLGANGTLAQSDGTKYSWTTATYPTTTTANRLLYSSATNTVTDLATANSATLVTSSTGVPAFTGSLTNGQLVIGSTGATPVVGSITGAGSITVTPGAGTIQISSSAGGVVNAGTANELAYYATSGSAVSGLATANSATLVTSSAGVPAWTSSMTNGQLLIGSTGATPVVGTITGTSGISVAVGAGTITLSGTGSGIGWNEITGASQTMAPDQGYVTNNAGLVTLTLPAVAAFGTVINIVGKGAGGWRIAQGAGQQIQVGSTASTVGAGGYVESTNQYDSIELLCTTANTTWTCLGGPQGNITIA